LLSAKEKLRSPTRPKSAEGLIKRIKNKELETASSVKSTSPTLWKVESTKLPRKSPKLTSEGADVTSEYSPFSSPAAIKKTSDSEDQMHTKDAARGQLSFQTTENTISHVISSNSVVSSRKY